ncbi:MAG: 3-deoxy-D-manno-octulosonic acid transferase, partial [Proteobacteria bacterium]|nr:3-deoxy-D-manno-octulosonic acid transferase [Pseudomonadota bacterium]
MIFVYKLAGYVLLILLLPFLFLLWLFSQKRRANLLARFGLKPGTKPTVSGQKRIWVHALSVGEVVSSVPFIKALKEKAPLTDIIFTASTKTGFDMAGHLFLNSDSSRNSENVWISQLEYFPFDLGFCIEKVRSRIAPDAVVIVETDLWPNFLYEMKKNNIPVILINARLSDRSLKGYQFFRSFSSLMFSSLAAIMAQSHRDKKRFECLGIEKEKIQVTGNIKFDQAA